MLHPFEYVAPTKESVEKITTLRAAMKGVHDLIVEEIPAGAERTLAIRKLEESSMWANKAIVFTQAGPSRPHPNPIAPELRPTA